MASSASNSGTPSGPELLSEILSRIFAARGIGRRQDRLRLERAWANVAGTEFAEYTRVAGLKRQVLEIEARSAVLVQELTQFHKRRLLQALRQALPNVTIADLRFRVGVW